MENILEQFPGGKLDIPLKNVKKHSLPDHFIESIKASVKSG